MIFPLSNVICIYLYIVVAVRVSHFYPQTKTNYEDEFRRPIARRRIPPRRRIPSRRRIPKTNSRRRIPTRRRIPPRRRIPKTNCSKTNSPLKTNSEDEFPKANSRLPNTNSEDELFEDTSCRNRDSRGHKRKREDSSEAGQEPNETSESNERKSSDQRERERERERDGPETKEMRQRRGTEFNLHVDREHTHNMYIYTCINSHIAHILYKFAWVHYSHYRYGFQPIYTIFIYIIYIYIYIHIYMYIHIHVYIYYTYTCRMFTLAHTQGLELKNTNTCTGQKHTS